MEKNENNFLFYKVLQSFANGCLSHKVKMWKKLHETHSISSQKRKKIEREICVLLILNMIGR